MKEYLYQAWELERSIGKLAKKLDRLYPEFSPRNMSVLGYWKDKPIIPIYEWIKIKDTPYALDYFPDDFDQSMTYMPENELEKGQERWNDIESQGGITQQTLGLL